MTEQQASEPQSADEWFQKPPYGGCTQFAPKYKASCFCKRVQFAVQTCPLASKICDCSTCMRLHGAPMQWAVLFQKDAVRFEAESIKFIRFYNTSEDAAYEDGRDRKLPCKLQCKHCGTWIADEGRNMFMAMPTLFEFVTGGARPEFPESFLPASHIFCATQALDMCDGLPRFLDDNRIPCTPGDFLRFIAPSLDGKGHKGQAGRIGVLGGSVDYAGAPYYAGISALRVGAELLYLCTADEATGPIKSYSPELMVSSVYNFAKISNSATAEEEVNSFVSKMVAVLPRLHALCIGPGLGRHDAVLRGVAKVIEEANQRELPMVIDADCLWLITQNTDLVKGCSHIVLTPNVMEFKRLSQAVLVKEDADLKELCIALAGPTIIRKGATDLIFSAGKQYLEPLACSQEGAPRRPGGIGDLLAGTITVLLGWTKQRRRCQVQACHAACTVVRRAACRAYQKQKRALVAPDVLDELGPAFEEFCPA